MIHCIFVPESIVNARRSCLSYNSKKGYMEMYNNTVKPAKYIHSHTIPSIFSNISIFTQHNNLKILTFAPETSNIRLLGCAPLSEAAAVI